MPASKPFKTGVKVTWTSQAGGWSKTKTGTVVAVVLAGNYPPNVKPPLMTGGHYRDHTSYVVHVPSKTGKGAGKHYWPKVENLTKV